MKKLLTIMVLGLFFSNISHAKDKIEYMQLGPMTGFDWSGIVFKSGKKVQVDFEKIGDKFYPLYYPDRSTLIPGDRVARYFMVDGKSVCGIPTKPTDISSRQIHKAWSFFKGKGYYTVEKNGKKRKLDIEEMLFDCVKFRNGKSEFPK
tara:strand:- start:230 stop:673 length:444 start_codon:yes stop_codon:yes gene_type:complete